MDRFQKVLALSVTSCQIYSHDIHTFHATSYFRSKTCLTTTVHNAPRLVVTKWLIGANVMQREGPPWWETLEVNAVVE